MCTCQDAKGNQTNLKICIPQDGGEKFHATGLMVLEKNWLEIYTPWEKWNGNKVIDECNGRSNNEV